MNKFELFGDNIKPEVLHDHRAVNNHIYAKIVHVKAIVSDEILGFHGMTGLQVNKIQLQDSDLVLVNFKNQIFWNGIWNVHSEAWDYNFDIQLNKRDNALIIVDGADTGWKIATQEEKENGALTQTFTRIFK